MASLISPRIERLEDLVAAPSVLIGSVVSMTYTDATIVTNDFQVRAAGGLPQRCFLLALPHVEEGEDLEEAILLSVEGTAPLSVQRDFMAVREDIALSGREAPLDARTRASMETLGLSCRVVGTFHYTSEGVRFGSDMDRIRGNSSYRVVKPMGGALGLIGSYGRGNEDGDSSSLSLGVVRYTETQKAPDDEARVFVDLTDFLAKKTAVLGMSRTGKALTADTRIPVPVSSRFPSGWAMNEDLVVGDLVFSSAGKPVKIVSLTDWKTEPVYEVRFSDGQSVRTAGDHLWKAHNSTRYHTRKAPANAAKKEARERKETQVLKLRALASTFDSTTYATLGTIADLSGLSLGQLLSAAKTSGIERQLGVTVGKYGPMPKRVNTEDNLYPVAELLIAAAQRRQNAGRPTKLAPTTTLVTSEELARDTRPGKSRWAVDLCSLDTPARDLPIDPYLLGYWLGDGTSKSGEIAVDNKPHLWSESGESDRDSLLRELEAAGYSYTLYPHAPMRVLVKGLYSGLRLNGLLGNKHIPIAYLRASKEQRLALLQGLMDSDGSAGIGGGQGIRFSNEKLALATLELIRSLGIAVTFKEKPSGYTDETGQRVACKPSYSMNFNTALPVFRLARKNARQRARIGHRVEWNRVVEVRVLPAAATRCLTVDSPDSLHLVEGFIPTHNSNTMKTICQKTFEHGRLTGHRTGQIIFDPQGEYANATRQDVAMEEDPSALANIGDESEVRIYKMLKDSENEEGKLRHLQINLLDDANVEFLWSLMLRNLSAGVSAGTNYIASLESLRFYRPGPKAAPEKKALWARQLLGVYGLVGAALSEVHALSTPLDVPLPGSVQDVTSLVEHLKASPDGEAVRVENTDDAHALLEWLMESEGRLSQELKRELKRGVLAPFKEQLEALKEGRNGVVAALRRAMPFHNPRAKGDVREKIWLDMVAGRLVMIDLSKGSSRTVTSLSELIASYLIDKSAENFTAGRANVNYQVVVEEAHNLFGDTASDEFTPWVRLSKEGAKYGIGLVYATQEVTGVDHRILSNTANFVVSHLSSTTETNQLARYYGFGSWSDHLMRVETKGFVRLKTESSPYIVPVQIDKFVVGIRPRMKQAESAAVEEPKLTGYSEEDYDALL